MVKTVSGRPTHPIYASSAMAIKTKSLVKKGQRSVFCLDRSPSGGMTIGITIAFVSEEGVKDYIFNALEATGSELEPSLY
jgi:hypothetical protein